MVKFYTGKLSNGQIKVKQSKIWYLIRESLAKPWEVRGFWENESFFPSKMAKMAENVLKKSPGDVFRLREHLPWEEKKFFVLHLVRSPNAIAKAFNVM